MTTVNKAAILRIVGDINARLELVDDFAVSDDLAMTYSEMGRSTLVILRAAFTLDRDQQRGSATSRQRAFCQSRIDLITQLLGEEPAAGDSQR